MADLWFVAAGYGLTAAVLGGYLVALRRRARRARERIARLAGGAGPPSP